jgi:uncharacterized protein YjgD (DUF1641 family)
MAKQIEFRPVLPSAEEETQRRLDAAPLEHADAVLNAFRTLQTLHDTNTLDFVRGLLGAGDEVLTQVVSVATSPQSTRAIRNLLVLTNILGSIDPDALQRITTTVTPALTERQPAEPPSLFAITKRIFSKDSRRALATGVTLLEAFGRSLGPAEKAEKK